MRPEERAGLQMYLLALGMAVFAVVAGLVVGRLIVEVLR